MPEDKTSHYSLAMPHADNLLEDDVNRLRAALTELDTQLFVAAEARQGLQAMLEAMQGSLEGQGSDFSAQLVALGNTLGQHAALAATPEAKGHTMPGTGLGIDANGKVSVTYGTAAGTACAGNDARLTNAASSSVAGHVKLNNTVSSTSTTEAATAAAVKQAFDKAASMTVPLNNTVSSTSTTEAATANAVKQAYDKANSAASSASSAQSTANSAYSMASSAQTAAGRAAPVPSRYSGVGQWASVGSSMPSGGTWAYHIVVGNGTGLVTQELVGIASGGSYISGANGYSGGFAWRFA